MMRFGKQPGTESEETQHIKNQELLGALMRVKAVIWFKPDGTILDANDNFCSALGYDLQEIKGKHHRLFVEADYARHADYAQFWDMLASGTFHEGQYRRVRKDGSAIWIQATYNPIFDEDGKVTKIVKFATDITQRREVFDAILSTFKAVSAGDLTARIPRIATGQLADMVNQFNADFDARERLVDNISQLARDIGHAGTELATQSDTTAQINDAQASGLMQTLEAVKSVDALVRTTVEALRASQQLASDADTKSGIGHQVVSDAADVISRIKDGSTRIENIVGVIDSIAFQTNLLSLNASVEAARAGEAGRGFAVVAQEVRNLAQDTAREASEIRELVRQSVQDIGQGVTVVERVGEVLSEIKNAIAAIVAHTADIDQTCDAQVQGISHAAEALTDLEATGQRAAESARRSADSIRELASRSDALDQLVSSFGSKPAVIAFQRHGLRAAG